MVLLSYYVKYTIAHPRAVATAAVRSDQQSGGLGIARPTDSTPPLSDAIDGKRSRVMVNADTHPTRSGSEVIDPVGHRPSQFLDEEVMDPDRFRVSLRAIFAAIVAEIPDQFLFLGVDRNHRLLLGQCGGHLGVDAGELRIPVGVAVTLFGFAVGLQAVARRIEQFGHQGAAHFVALRLQRLRQPSHALAGPPQRRFRIPAGRWFDQRLEIGEQGRVLANRRLAPRPRPPNPRGWLILRQFLQTAPDRARRHARRHRHRGNATISHGKRLRRRDQTTAPFIKKRRHRQKPLANGLDIDHNHHIWYEKTVVNSIFTLSEVDSIISGRALRSSKSGEGKKPASALFPAGLSPIRGPSLTLDTKVSAWLQCVVGSS